MKLLETSSGKFIVEPKDINLMLANPNNLGRKLMLVCGKCSLPLVPGQIINSSKGLILSVTGNCKGCI